MEKGHKNKSKSVIVTLNYEDTNYQFSTELSKPIEAFYTEVCSFLNINPKYYFLYYNSTQISFKLNPALVISDIIDKNPNSVFRIIKKKTKTVNLRYQINNDQKDKKINSRNQNFNQLFLSTKDVAKNFFFFF